MDHRLLTLLLPRVHKVISKIPRIPYYDLILQIHVFLLHSFDRDPDLSRKDWTKTSSIFRAERAAGPTYSDLDAM